MFLNPRNLEKPHTISIRAIVCDSEKSRFNSVCKADLSVREVDDARRLFERLISVGFHNCLKQEIVVAKTTSRLILPLPILSDLCG